MPLDLTIKWFMLYEVNSSLNKSVNPLPLSRHGVAVTPNFFASGNASIMDE
jgi:hypothetical protein